ncbi:MAG: hypothetical protein PWP65_1708 [Clostridia bacterium]|nr:hypothetical protein [Clostridia bacterium]
MAVIATPVDSSLRLMVQTGTDASGNPVYRYRTFNRVKPQAGDQEVYDVAQVLAGLQVHTLVGINRVNENELVAGA